MKMLTDNQRQWMNSQCSSTQANNTTPNQVVIHNYQPIAGSVQDSGSFIGTVYRIAAFVSTALVLTVVITSTVKGTMPSETIALLEEINVTSIEISDIKNGFFKTFDGWFK